MVPKKPGFQNLTQIAERCGSHCGNVRQICRYHSITMTPAASGRVLFVADAEVEKIEGLVRLYAQWRATLTDIHRC
jgi:hypothetical protein